jgi:hypothetical protein
MSVLTIPPPQLAKRQLSTMSQGAHKKTKDCGHPDVFGYSQLSDGGIFASPATVPQLIHDRGWWLCKSVIDVSSFYNRHQFDLP